MIDDGGNGEDGSRLADDYGSLGLPGLTLRPALSHYYGDHVRKLFFLASIILLIVVPFLMSTVPMAVPFGIGGMVVFIILAALTNPKNTSIMIANAVAAGLAVLLFEVFALTAYSLSLWVVFLVCEVLAIIFLFALYFSLKTVRAMMLGVIGKEHKTGQVD